MIVRLLLPFILLASSAQARTETFRWLDTNPLPSPVVYFKLYIGSSSGNYNTTIDFGLPTPDASGVYSSTVNIPDTDTVYVVLTASDITGIESAFSNEQIRNATVPTPTPLPTPTPSPGILPLPSIAHWRFDEGAGLVAGDSSGSGLAGIIDGPLWVADARGTSLLFDGINDSVDVVSADVFGQSMTISLWFKASSFAVSDARLISKAIGVNSSEHYWMISTIDSGGIKLRFRVRTGNSTSELKASGGNLTLNLWTHVAVVYDGATMRIYKDGFQVGTAPKSGTLATNSSVMTSIGNQPSVAGSRPFDGLIDDVRIYSQALTGQHIMQLFQMGSETPVRPLPPILY